LHGKRKVPISNQGDFVDLLENSLQAGILHVVFDNAGKMEILKVPPIQISTILQFIYEDPPMSMLIQSIAVPLFEDGQGGLRVTGTRVLLERIVYAFQDGETPEGIVQSYDTLQLADVYAVLAWYLKQKDEVADYLRKRAAEATEIRRTIEAKQPDRAGSRTPLMARRVQQEKAQGSSGQ